MHEINPTTNEENQQDDSSFTRQLATIEALKIRVREVNQTNRGGVWSEVEEQLYQAQLKANYQLVDEYIAGNLDWRATLEGFCEITGEDLTHLLSQLSEIAPGVPVLHESHYGGLIVRHADGTITIDNISLYPDKYKTDYSLTTNVAVSIGIPEDGDVITLGKDSGDKVGTEAIFEHYSNEIASLAAVSNITIRNMYELEGIKRAINGANLAISPAIEASKHKLLSDFINKITQETSSDITASDVIRLIADDVEINRDTTIIDTLLASDLIGREASGNYSRELAGLGEVIKRAESSDYLPPPANLSELDEQEYRGAQDVMRTLERRNELLVQGMARQQK